MGSYEKAIKTGYICRLCSQMDRVVIHIYSDVGQKLKIAERIRMHLPVKVELTDPLPKTVCWTCIKKLDEQDELMQLLNFAKEREMMRQQMASLISTSIESVANSFSEQ